MKARKGIDLRGEAAADTVLEARDKGGKGAAARGAANGSAVGVRKGAGVGISVVHAAVETAVRARIEVIAVSVPNGVKRHQSLQSLV